MGSTQAQPSARPPHGTKRIAMVAYTHYQTDPRCRREATLALEGGWEVHFFALSTDGLSRSSRVEGIHLHELPMDRYRGDSGSRYIISYLRFFFLATAAVQKAHLGQRFHVVHVNTMPDFMVGTALLPRLCGAKVILDIHDVMPEIYQTKFGLPASHWKIKLIKAQEVLSTRLAHKVLTAEHPKGELLIEHGVAPEKVQVLLNLPDDAHFVPQFILSDPRFTEAPVQEDSPFRLFYHGTIAHRLGLDTALAALAEVRKSYPSVSMKMYGDGDQMPDLLQMTEELDLGDHIWFSRGFKPIEEVIPEIKKAHLAVIPTRHEISTDFMLPTKFLEYLAFGIPALVTPTRTVRHYFGDSHPLYLEDPTPEKTARKIIWARENFAEAKRLTAQLQDRWFSEFHWPQHKLSYLGLLDGMVSGNPQGGRA